MLQKKYQLKNGMNVLLIESKKSPVVSIQMWVKTGSADETKGIEGISHFIEHLVFKGTQKYGVGQIASAVEAAGGVLNAYTTFDQTVFYVTLSRDFVDTGLDVISEMMVRPSFDRQEIDNEREVVIEEIKRSADSPHSQATRLLFSTLYKKHPYSVPVIGYDDNIRRVSRDEIIKYFSQRYVPQNMNLVIVGDFKNSDMQKKVSQYFGTAKKQKLAIVKRASEPIQKTSRVVVKNAAFNENFLYLSWPATKASHKDATMLYLISVILGQGESSRLYQRLRNELHLVQSIGASTFAPKEPGFFAISMSLKKENLDAAIKAVDKVVTDFLAEGPTSEEIERAIRILESDKFYSMETVDGLAGLYGHYEFLYNDYKAFEKMLSLFKKITPVELLKVAKKYLKPQLINVSYLTNDNAKEAEEKIKRNLKKLKYPEQIKSKINAAKKLKTRVAPLNWRPSKKEGAHLPERKELKSGATLLVKKISGSPTANVKFGFLGGLRTEAANLGGVNELSSRVWSATTHKYSEEELSRKIETMASGLGAFAGRNSLGLSMTALTPNFKGTWEILCDVLLNYKIDEKILIREKQQMIESIKQRSDKPAQICMLQFANLMFKGHPYAKDPLGTVESVTQLTPENVKAHLAKSIASQNMVISVAGDKSCGELFKLVEAFENKLKKKPDLANVQLPPELTSHSKKYFELKKEQTHIVLGYRGLTFRDSRRFALEVIQSVLSGQGGRLFIELRDKASLAYTVSPIRMDGVDVGYFGGYIGCSPQKSDTAIKMMRDEFIKLSREKLSEAELQRAKRYLIGRHHISLQKTSHLTDLMLFDELYGAKFNEHEFYAEAIQSVTLDDVLNVAKDIFSQPEVISIVGPTDVSV